MRSPPHSAELPERTAELGILVVERRDFALDCHGTDVPPAVAVADHHGGVLVDPFGLKHALSDRSGEGHHRSRLEIRDAEFRIVPRHLGMLPPDPGELAVIRREAREREEVRSGGQQADAGPVVCAGAVELHSNDVPRHGAGRVRLTDGDDLGSAHADVAESKAPADAGKTSPAAVTTAYRPPSLGRASHHHTSSPTQHPSCTG
jgi:hypothetical protein